MKSLSRQCLAVLFGVLLLAAQAGAQEVRVAVVNLDRLLREAGPAKAAEAKLQQEFARREKEINDMGVALKAASEKFDRDTPTLTESQRQQRQRQLVDQEREFQRKRRELQEDANARKNEELQVLLERASRAVKQVAEAEKYDIVLQEAAYFNPKHDITDKVIRALNAAR